MTPLPLVEFLTISLPWMTASVFAYDAYEPRTLRNELSRRSRLGVDAALYVAKGVLSGLQHLHGQGLLHRDIKPDNILFINAEPKLGDVDRFHRHADQGVIREPRIDTVRGHEDIIARKRYRGAIRGMQALLFDVPCHPTVAAGA